MVGSRLQMVCPALLAAVTFWKSPATIAVFGSFEKNGMPIGHLMPFVFRMGWAGGGGPDSGENRLQFGHFSAMDLCFCRDVNT